MSDFEVERWDPDEPGWEGFGGDSNFYFGPEERGIIILDFKYVGRHRFVRDSGALYVSRVVDGRRLDLRFDRVWSCSVFDLQLLFCNREMAARMGIGIVRRIAGYTVGRGTPWWDGTWQTTLIG
jgi:hypothetical protein